MPNTEADLVRLVMENVANWSPAQTISAEDYATIKERIPLAVAKLIAKGVDIGPDTINLNDIPSEIFLPLADVVAHSCAQSFAADANKRAELKGYADEAFADLTLYYREGFPRRTLQIPHIGRRRLW